MYPELCRKRATPAISGKEFFYPLASFYCWDLSSLPASSAEAEVWVDDNGYYTVGAYEYKEYLENCELYLKIKAFNGKYDD